MMDYSDYQNMMGGSSWGVGPFMWLMFLLTLLVLVLGIIALWKYISKG